MTCEEAMQEQFVPEGLTPWKGPMLELFMKGCFLWERSHAGAGEEHGEEGAAEMTCYELTATSIPHPPELPTGRR